MQTTGNAKSVRDLRPTDRNLEYERSRFVRIEQEFKPSEHLTADGRAGRYGAGHTMAPSPSANPCRALAQAIGSYDRKLAAWFVEVESGRKIGTLPALVRGIIGMGGHLVVLLNKAPEN